MLKKKRKTVSVRKGKWGKNDVDVYWIFVNGKRIYGPYGSKLLANASAKAIRKRIIS